MTDPGLGITNSVMYALKGFGIEETDRTKLYRFIRAASCDSFQEFYGFTREEAKRGIDLYREYYRDRGIFENRVYNGMEEMLGTLKQRGKTLVLATSKPEPLPAKYWIIFIWLLILPMRRERPWTRQG